MSVAPPPCPVSLPPLSSKVSVFLKFCVQLNIVNHFDFRFVTCWPIRFPSFHFHFYLPQPRVIISQPFTPQPSFRPARPSQGRHPGCKLLPPLCRSGPAEPAAQPPAPHFPPPPPGASPTKPKSHNLLPLHEGLPP